MNEYSGQSIDVTGSIVNYNGEPEIEVTSASQITQAN
jgi:DNA/RNA endonuclease YhcR with UshA esterase domain